MATATEPRGRPSLLTPELVEKAAELMAKHRYQRQVAVCLGVSRASFERWLARGRRVERRLRDDTEPTEPTGADALCLRLLRELKKALADTHGVLVARIEAASEKSWQAAAWLLERRHPDLWGDRRREIKDLERQVADLVKRLDLAPERT